MTGVLQDIRYGLRMLASRPGVTAAAIISLALGVGANAAVFSLIDSVVFKTLPVEAPGRLVILGPSQGRGVTTSTAPVVNLFSYPRYRQLHDGSESLSAVAAMSSTDASTDVVHRQNRIIFTQRPARIDHFLATTLHFRVMALYRSKIAPTVTTAYLG